MEGFAGGKWPWGVAAWTGPKPESDIVSDRGLTMSALKQSVEMWETEKREAYYVGHAAYNHWLGWLKDVEKGNAEDPKAGMQGNGWCFDVLIHSRRIAGRWLEERAGNFDEEVAKQLRVAADHYSLIAELCKEGIECPWDPALAPVSIDDWSSEMRQEQIARLEASREHDREAVGAVKDALEVLNQNAM